jgi:thiol:disulfide interchange protein DsbD
MITPLSTAHSGLRGGKLASVALMGMLSAAIVSPCVAAPLAGALLYIGQTGDTLLGGAALFSMAAGMGAPLLLIGLTGATFLPKSGPWMNAVKYFFGVLLLALAIWMVSPVLPNAAHLALWAALLIGVAVFLGALDSLPPDAPAVARLAKTLGILALIAGTAQGYGALSGATDPLQPIAIVKANREAPIQTARFDGLRTLADLDGHLGQGRTPVMLDFSAAWCVACKEMDRFTFSDARVQARLAGIRLLRADVTHNTPEDKAMLKRFRLFGPPGIIFFDGDGRELTDARVIGYQPADKFLTTLDRIASPRS